jgi:hypothetical protein
MKPINWRIVLAEFVGCMVLEFMSGGAVIASAMGGNLVTAALGMGFSLAIVTFCEYISHAFCFEAHLVVK